MSKNHEVRKLENFELYQRYIDTRQGEYLVELSGRAAGDNKPANKSEPKRLLFAIEQELPFLNDVAEIQPETRSKIEQFCTIISHPLLAIRTFTRQQEVGVEMASPPSGSTIEDFIDLPLTSAMKLMRNQDFLDQAKRSSMQYTPADLERMKTGQSPIAPPEHLDL